VGEHLGGLFVAAGLEPAVGVDPQAPRVDGICGPVQECGDLGDGRHLRRVHVVDPGADTALVVSSAEASGDRHGRRAGEAEGPGRPGEVLGLGGTPQGQAFAQRRFVDLDDGDTGFTSSSSSGSRELVRTAFSSEVMASIAAGKTLR
jgi:hypothetical protein